MPKMNKLQWVRTAALAGAVIGTGQLAAVPAGAAELGATEEPIRLAMLEWTGAQISTQIAGRILEEAGYTVEYVTAGNYPQFTGLSDGTLSASVEIWLNNVGEIYPVALAEGKVLDIGTLGLETQEGWAYPRFMEEVCPGLPDWTALQSPDCVAALATPETLPLGRFLDYPSDWGSRAAAIIADTGLPLTAVPAGSEGAMVAELRAAEATRTPLLMMFWGPHFILADVDVGWVTLPPCAEQTEERCINPPDVNKVVWSGLGERWPAALEILEDFRVTTEDQQRMMFRMDEEGASLAEVADDWMAANVAVWRPWVDAAVD